MKKIAWMVIFTGFAMILTPNTADACSCMMPDINRSYSQADDVAQVRIVGKLFFSRSGHHWYLGAVRETFKGCLDQGQWVIVETRDNSAACGMYIQKDDYLLNGTDKGTFWGIPIIGVGLCDYNKTWDTVTLNDRDYLYSRYNCCGDECSCTDGSQPVNCFVDPCMVSECDDPEATCSANYCGGCRAEWYDAWGGIAECVPGCESDEDCSTDTWCRENRNGKGECVTYAGPGETCEGFVMPWTRERCEPELTCFHSEPTGDAPGTCAACIYDGKPYQGWESFPSTDGCNTCSCTEGGGVACTEMACFESCDPAVDRACDDPEKVCMAETIDETGICEPFGHGTTVGAGYSCGGSIGVSCATGLFCKGLPYGGMIGGSGVCTQMDCGDWSEEYSRLVSANNQCEVADDCEAISGTSCGCTRDLVLSKKADMDTFNTVTDLMKKDGCNPFISICDCPLANGFKCEQGRCSWNYVDSNGL